MLIIQATQYSFMLHFSESEWKGMSEYAIQNILLNFEIWNGDFAAFGLTQILYAEG